MTLTLVVKSLVLMTLAAAPADAGSGAFERAMAERACGVAAYSSITQSDDDGSCVSRQLAALHADFGRDLSGLSLRERRSVDAACGRLNTPVAREAYLDCLNGQIAVLRASRSKSGQVHQAVRARALPAAPAPAKESQEPASTTIILAVAIGAAVVTASAGWLVFRARRSPTSAASAASV